MAIAAPRDAIAQTPSKVYRLALISPGGLVAQSQPNAKFLLGPLAQLGYVVGQNLVFDGSPGVPGQAVQIPQLMEQLKSNKDDVIFAWCYLEALADTLH